MNILEKRETILKDNNTAQSQLASILEKTDTSASELDIREPLSGHVDFSILKASGFSRVKHIQIMKGDITDITGLPRDLEKLTCADQYLISLNNLPKTLLELNIEHNFLETIDLLETPALIHLNVSDNKLKTIQNIPSSLIELYCDNNQIDRLDLKDLFQLTVLHCSNNRAIIVENIPPSLTDIQMDNSPFIGVNYSGMGQPLKPKSDEENQVKIIDYMDALNQYFKLKSNYETNLFADKKTVYNNALVREMGKRRAKKLAANVLPKCISCKRRVGSIFKSIIDDKNRPMYIATCGDKENPCSLRIELFKGKPLEVESTLIELIEERESLKDDIVLKKLNTIFKYSNENAMIKQFNETMEEFTLVNGFTKQIYEKHNLMYKDPIREQLISKEYQDIYSMISSIKNIMKEYQLNPQAHLMKSAIEIQKELNSKILKVRLMKYEILEMDSVVIKNKVIKVDEEDEISGFTGSKVFKRYGKLQNIQDFGPDVPQVIHFSV